MKSVKAVSAVDRKKIPAKYQRALATLSPRAHLSLAILALAGVQTQSEHILRIIPNSSQALYPEDRRVNSQVLEELLQGKLLTREGGRFRAAEALIVIGPWEQLKGDDWELVQQGALLLASLRKPRWGEEAIARNRILTRCGFYSGEPSEFLNRVQDLHEVDDNWFDTCESLALGAGSADFWNVQKNCWLILFDLLSNFPKRNEGLDHLVKLYDYCLPPISEVDEGSLPMRLTINQLKSKEALHRGNWSALAQRSVVPGGLNPLGVAIPWLQGRMSTDEFLVRRIKGPSSASRNQPVGKKPPKPEWGDVGNALYTIALLVQDTPVSNREAARISKTCKTLHYDIGVLLAYHCHQLAQFRLGRRPSSWGRLSDDGDPEIYVLLNQVVLAWLPEALRNTWLQESSALEVLSEGIAAAPREKWFARQCYALLRRDDPKAARRLQESSDLALKENPSGELLLADLVVVKPPWEQIFEQLERSVVAAETDSSKGGSIKKAPSKKRLAWIIGFYGKVWVIEARLQTLKGNHYSAGRKVALKKLHEGNYPCEPSALDLRLIALILREEERGYYRGYPEISYQLSPSALPLLSEHPAVFEEDSMVPLTIEPASPQVDWETVDGGFRLQPTPPSGDAISCSRQGSVVSVYSLNSEQQKLFTLLLSTGLFPEEARERAQEMLKRLSGTVLCIDEKGAVGDIQEIPAVGQIIVQLTPAKGSLNIAFLVRPLGEGGPAFSPGAGPRRVHGKVKGVSSLARRDQKSERDDAEKISGELPQLSELREEGDPESFQFELHELESILELVSRLAKGNYLVEWPEGSPYRIKKAKRATVTVSAASDVDWLDAQITVPIDDETALDHATVLAAARGGRRFIALHDGSFAELSHSLLKQVQKLAAFQLDEDKPERWHPMASLAIEDNESLRVEAGEGWAARKSEIEEAFSKPVRIPKSLQASLRDYQAEGVKWAVRLSRIGMGACLADDMGLGKTVQTLAVLLSRASQGPALVVAPASVVSGWQREAERFAPSLKISLLAELPAGAKGAGRRLPKLGKKCVLLTTYDLAYREIVALSSVEWSSLILDEAQAIKNPDARRTRAISELRAGFTMALSGTPIENHLLELWSLFHVVNPGLLGTRASFVQRFQHPIEKGSDPVKNSQLSTLIAPFMLRRTKDQVLKELPPRTEMALEIILSPEERTLYEATRRDAVERLQEDVGREKTSPLQILAELTKLRQLCCHPRLAFPRSKVESSKLAALLELLKDLQDGGHRALIFSQFVQHLALLRERLDAQRTEYLYLDGSTKTKERQARVDSFQEGKAPFFLISLKAGGLGLNLTAADTVIHLDPWWNPAVENQASDRAHRMGQERPVTVIRLITKGTIEEKLIALHEKKRDLADQILSQTGSATRMSAKDLLRLMCAD